MKSLFAVIFTFLFLVLVMPVYLFTYIFKKKNPHKIALFELRCVQWAFNVIMRGCGIKVNYSGDENIPKEPALFISNHRGMFDILAAYAHMPDLTGFIAKDAIRKVPLLNFVMKRINCLFLNRKDPRQGLKTINESMELLKNGVSIFIFPEGTRSKNDDPSVLLPMHDGSFRPAKKLGVPVVPVSIIGSDTIFEKHIPWIRSGHISVRFGKPEYYADLSEENKKHIGDYFSNVLTNMIKDDLTL